jgi:hypothetical protein
MYILQLKFFHYHKIRGIKKERRKWREEDEEEEEERERKKRDRERERKKKNISAAGIEPATT